MDLGQQRGSAKAQHTPAFIHALVLAALADGGFDDDDDTNESYPTARGGFTDVGQHTGSERRDTCWPLVREVIKVCESRGVWNGL